MINNNIIHKRSGLDRVPSRRSTFLSKFLGKRPTVEELTCKGIVKVIAINTLEIVKTIRIDKAMYRATQFLAARLRTKFS